ncbi:GCN5-related N-acetyltransferase [Verrucomicrobia bacterium]|nr:GCN5-related N-acetyltransferase [Verrucomicrobiota bacterium]
MSSGPYLLEPMSPRDFPQVLRLWRSTEGIGLTESDSRPNLAAYLKRNPGMSFVARHGRHIVGAVLCGHDGRRGYLHHLAVGEPHRRKGLGKGLVNTCLGRLARCGILKCNIFLYADNAEGEAFWTHSGWTKRTDLRLLQKPVKLRL